MDWRERIRNLWIERAVWMRHYIISIMMGLRDLSFISTRLLTNGAQIAQIISYFYGVEIANQFENLLTRNVLLLSELASTVKHGGNIEPLTTNWNAIANELLDLLLQANPYIDKATWEAYLNDQIKLQMDLVLSLNEEKYSEGISNFDLAYDNATKIARQMIEEIEMQFSLSMAAPTSSGAINMPSSTIQTMG